MISVVPSLVKYETPVLLPRIQEGGGASSKPKAKKEASRGENDKAAPRPEDVLYSIIPPREFEQDGQRWVQYPSSTPATRLDVINLQETLDELLVQRQARETGICPIREELYSQAFDELIRQVTINCAERGLLLLRVRDEIRMTLDAYRSIYESSAAFGMRKALHAEQNRVKLEAQVFALEREKQALQQQVLDLEEECKQMEDAEMQRREAVEQKHAEEINYFRRTYQTLTANMQTVVNPTKT
ncbi:unnamed protein product [Phytomonas sp. EM1]|nr:unnamed protein product [Phytomonas sp. EM1]|eukprot:CCW62521.1 unnamed protein product [Phytomonas sp. isolate EM1]